jgi:hypothetical protein
MFATHEFHGNWGNWAEVGGPKAVKLAAAGHRNGLQVWAIDHDMKLWSITQGGAKSGEWEGPNWNAAPHLHRITATALSGNVSARAWAITAKDYSLITCYRADGQWSPWAPIPATPHNSKFRDIAGVTQMDGRVALFAVDTKLQLWCRHELAAGGSEWSNWLGPNWNGAPAFCRVTACQQGAGRGARIWGTTPDLVSVLSIYQNSATGSWSAWVPGTSKGLGHSINVAAAPQADGNIRLWANSWENCSLDSIQEASPGGEWKNWEQ